MDSDIQEFSFFLSVEQAEIDKLLAVFIGTELTTRRF